jgi:hypothetical protein
MQFVGWFDATAIFHGSMALKKQRSLGPAAVA